MRVRFTRRALADLDHAYAYIAEDSPGNAEAVIGRVEKTIDMLRKHPSLGKSGRVAGTREIPVPHTPFLVVYRTVDDDLQILTILHTSRRYPE